MAPGRYYLPDSYTCPIPQVVPGPDLEHFRPRAKSKYLIFRQHQEGKGGELGASLKVVTLCMSDGSKKMGQIKYLLID